MVAAMSRGAGVRDDTAPVGGLEMVDREGRKGTPPTTTTVAPEATTPFSQRRLPRRSSSPRCRRLDARRDVGGPPAPLSADQPVRQRYEQVPVRGKDRAVDPRTSRPPARRSAAGILVGTAEAAPARQQWRTPG